MISNSIYQVSVIVPVYNCEKYIEKCLDSIYEQKTSLSYEVIVVNDGSTDESEKICKLYENRDDFVYCKKENEGVSEARNTGMKLSRGKYVIFIDGDDYVLPDYLENIVGMAVKNDLDMSVGGCQILYEKTGTKIINKFDNTEIFYNKETIKNAVKKFGADGLLNIAVSKCFKRDIIVKYNLEYNKDLKSGEDLCFNSKYMEYINNIGLSEDFSYCYIRRDIESGVNSYKDNILEMTKVCLDAVAGLYKYFQLNDNESKILLGNFYIDYISNGIYNSYRKGCKISGKIRRKNIRDLYALDSNSIVKFNNRIDILSKVSTFLMKIDNEYFTDFIYKGLFFIRNNFSELYYHIRNKWIHKVTV